MEIRLLTAEDAAALWRLRLEALELEPKNFGTSPEEHRVQSVDAIAANLAHSGNDYFVLGVFEDGDLKGSVGFARNHRVKMRHKGTVWGVYVTPSFRNKGAGRALMNALIERASAVPGLEQLQLSVDTGSLTARNIYQSSGFEVFGEERDALRVNGDKFDQYHMVCHLHR